MNSQQAREILTEMFPAARIVEAFGNPNLIGSWAFLVDGCDVLVDFDGCVWEDQPAEAA
jgi:hypothetical protein